MTAVLELAGAGKVYPGTPPVRSLHDVTLTVHSGELVAVVGPSGSGKTTLLYLAAGLDRRQPARCASPGSRSSTCPTGRCPGCAPTGWAWCSSSSSCSTG